MLYQDSDWHRKLGEANSESYRTEVRRDAARVLHSPSFRRLQGKTQLFPSFESDFFRNRLTHSLEVGQVAKSIAIRLNVECDALKDNPIDSDLVEMAGWMHDLGHPPFGHQGEAVLNQLMKADGGFEGNAQTLRLLTRVEKKRLESGSAPFEKGTENRLGLNLTARSLASILKYDRPIPMNGSAGADLTKGYYNSEKEIVDWVRESLGTMQSSLKTVECSIMDLADDIAYSTYDLEDALKAGFVSVTDILSTDENTLARVAEKVATALNKPFVAGDVGAILERVFAEDIRKEEKAGSMSLLDGVRFAQGVSRQLCEVGYYRTGFTSGLLKILMRAIDIDYNRECACLSSVTMRADEKAMMETLKNFTYVTVIGSPKVQVQQFRAKDVICTIFEALLDPDGRFLLPDDYRQLWERTTGAERKRVVCDFISGMTDRYAVEFFGRLRSESPQTIFKPV